MARCDLFWINRDFILGLSIALGFTQLRISLAQVPHELVTFSAPAEVQSPTDNSATLSTAGNDPRANTKYQTIALDPKLLDELQLTLPDMPLCWSHARAENPGHSQNNDESTLDRVGGSAGRSGASDPLLGSYVTASAAAQPKPALQQNHEMNNMPGMPATDPSGNVCETMGAMNGMSVMGESMAAMANHMCITPMRTLQLRDEERAKAVVAQVKAAIEKYKDYKRAIADGYVQANPKVDQPQFHFTNSANAKLADTQFDPTRPTSLLYLRTPTQRFKLEGVMFTARQSATEDELNQRVPLSIARWHKHTNFCGAPANKVKEYFGQHPKFGMFGSIYSQEACEAEGGTFFPVMFTWMIHVFPYEEDFKDVFSMNDDIPHVH